MFNVDGAKCALGVTTARGSGQTSAGCKVLMSEGRLHFILLGYLMDFDFDPTLQHSL